MTDIAISIKSCKTQIEIDSQNYYVSTIEHELTQTVNPLKENPDIIIDSINQTNRINMPMTDICGSSSANKTPHSVVGFLSVEKKDDYM